MESHSIARVPEHTHPLADWHQLVATHEAQGLHIDRHTAAARLHGDSYDHGMPVESLLRRSQRGHHCISGLPHG